MNQWLALAWSVWRLAFPPLPLSFLSFIPSLFFSRSLSHCLHLSLLPSTPSLAHLPLPACLLLTNTQLISVWRLVVLPAHWSLLLKTERTWDTHVAACQPVCVFWITGVFIQQLCVCVHACLRAEIWWGVIGMSAECKYLLNCTRSSARVCTWDKTHLHVHKLILTYWFCDSLMPSPNSVCFTVSVWMCRLVLVLCVGRENKRAGQQPNGWQPHQSW